MIRTMKSVLWIVSLRCEEADRMMSDSLDRRLGWAERLALRGHMLVCRSCRRAGRKLRSIRRALSKSLEQVDAAGDTLSAEARERIRAALRNSG